MTKQILDFLTTHTFHNSWEFFNNQAGTLVTALMEGQPWLLGWRWAGGVNGAFRLVRENEAGQPIEVVLVINEPESEAEFMLKTLKRVQRIQERLVVKPNTFGQFVAMIGNGLGITRCITHEGPSRDSHDDNKYRVHPIGELPGLVDYEIEKFRKIKFPEPEAEVA